MSQDSNIVDISLSKKKRFRLSDREKIIVAYHAFENQNPEEATKLLGSVNQTYYLVQFHKDISRALLCWATRESAQDVNMAKESEFYIIVYRLTKTIVGNKMTFPSCGYFFELRDTLFKDFDL